MASLNPESVLEHHQNLCTVCASHDWEYHIRRFEDCRLLEDRKAWEQDEGGLLFLPKQDKLGSPYFWELIAHDSILTPLRKSK